MLCSKASFLYPFNGWDDFNSFYTVGSGWANGLIPYKDLFEQKGPFLYLIFMVGYLISPGKFLGVFGLEVIFFTFTLYFSGKIIDLFISNEKDSREKYLILIIYAVIMTTSISFVEGGSSEEFNLLFITITIFYILKYLKKSDLMNITYKDLIINGLCCGLSLMIKYTTVGIWFIMMAYICIKLIILKKYKESFIKGLVFILSMIVPFSIFAVYFYINNALFDFLNTYFYINIFKYSMGSNILRNIINSFINLGIAVLSNISLTIMLYSMFLYYLYKKVKNNYKIKISKKQMLFLFFIVFYLIILYYGQNFWPYTLTSAFFVVLLVIIYIFKLFYKHRVFKYLYVIFILVSLIFLVDYDYMIVNKNDVVQYRFAKIINQYDNPTLLQYRSIDEGFYTASGIFPINKFFEQVNIGFDNLPQSYYEQDSLIMNKEVMFVIVRKYNLNRSDDFNDINYDKKMIFNAMANLDFIKNNYELIDKYDNKIGYYNTCTYYLYKVKE